MPSPKPAKRMRLLPVVVVAGLVVAMIGSGQDMAQAAVDGELDPTFGNAGIVTTDFGANEHATAVAVQPDGKIVAAGFAGNGMDFGLARYDADGTLDASFGAGGKVVTDLGTSNDQLHAMALQPDGKIVAVGSGEGDVMVVRYENNGSIDPTFAFGAVKAGPAGTYWANALAVQGDGKVVVAGSFANAGLFDQVLVMRLLTDGSLDLTFGNGGVVITKGGSAKAIALQEDGKVVVAGSNQTSFVGCAPWDPCDMEFVVFRYNPDGAPDTTFGDGGMVKTGKPGDTNEAHGLVVQPDGKIVAAGSRYMPLTPPDVTSDFLMVRYNTDGTLDSSFGASGEVTTDFGAYDFAYALALQADGKLVAAGGGRTSDPGAATDFAIARYDPDGTLDSSFGSGGRVLVDLGGSDTGRGLAVQPDGNIVVAGAGGPQLSDFALVRLIGPTPETIGLVDPSTGRWYLPNSWGQVVSFYYGVPGDLPFVGDWDCDGVDTPGLYRASDGYVYLRNTNTQGIADIRFFFGNPNDVPLAGDFNGDGCDTVSVYRPSEQRFYIINRLGANGGGLGPADFDFRFGNPDDTPVVGDFDGDGGDEIGLHRTSTGWLYWRNSLTTGLADGSIVFGDPGDRLIVGDWGQVDGLDTPGVYRPWLATFYLRYTLTGGIADSRIVWPDAGSHWLPVAGEFGSG